ncbi:phenylacetate--CoA ligase family protein [Gandjariella thermophila]|uniref:phenylacetate--CoA ligase family protein n=1 Tax=Gandjariella thermophila TaxID=1931992 RepID=UPI0010F9F306|nr:phenylacetate--CoA ligase family protein [Gandjariella thermophila]
MKADYRRGFPAQVVNPDESLNPDLVFTSRSSGTTGERLITVVHRDVLAERMLSTVAMNDGIRRNVVGSHNKRVARLAAPNCSDVECATPFTTMNDRVLPDGTLVLPVAHDVLATPPSMVDQIIEELEAYQPAWLYMDPTHLAFLCEALAERGITHIPGAAVILTYSMCARPAMRAIGSVFGDDVPVAEVLSMSEFGWLGMECGYGARHLNTECFYFEFLPTADDEIRELVVTSLGDVLSPHIRYRTGDLVEVVADACPCGSPGPVVVHHGRTSACVRDGSARVTARMVDQAIGEIEEIRFYRVDQLSEQAVRCRLMLHDCDHAKVTRLVEERLREVLPTAGEVRASVVTHIEAERSGKFAYCGGPAGKGETRR